MLVSEGSVLARSCVLPVREGCCAVFFGGGGLGGGRARVARLCFSLFMQTRARVYMRAHKRRNKKTNGWTDGAAVRAHVLFL